MQADAEHQQDDADLGQFAGQGKIGGEARRERADHDARHQIADQRLDAQPVGDQAEDIGQHEARGDVGNERCLMLRHRFSFSAAGCSASRCGPKAATFQSLTSLPAGIDTPATTGRKQMKLDRRGFLAGSAIALGSQFGVAPAVHADTFPSKSIRWVIPFAPGGNYDVTARLVSDPMSRQLGQTIVIDNRPGSGGVVGLEAAVTAPADGYTIVMASFTVGYVAPIFAGRPQMLQALVPVSILTTAPTLIVAQAGSRFTDIKTLLAEVKAKPATVTMGHSGNGTTNHVAILRQQLNENIKFNIIPYRGSGPGINDLLAGTIDCFADQLTS